MAELTKEEYLIAYLQIRQMVTCEAFAKVLGVDNATLGAALSRDAMDHYNELSEGVKQSLAQRMLANLHESDGPAKVLISTEECLVCADSILTLKK